MKVKNFKKCKNGIIHFRKVYPKDVQSVLGYEFNRTCKTRFISEAVALQEKFVLQFQSNVKRARSSIGVTDDVFNSNLIEEFGLVKATRPLESIDYSELMQILGLNIQALKSGPITGAATQAFYASFNPTLYVDGLYQQYKDKIAHELNRKNARELKKRLDPIELAINEFKSFFGDADIYRLSASKVEEWQNHYVPLIKSGRYKAATINKRIGFLRTMFRRVHRNKIPAPLNPFEIEPLEEYDNGKRPPFSEKEVAVALEKLPKSDLNRETKAMIVIALHTGTSPKELALLASQDIVLNGSIPHIFIRPNEFRHQVKGGNERHRQIPLVGDALSEMQLFPGGFSRYQYPGGAEAVSANANKFLKKHTGKTFYSSRHRFSDLLKNSGCDQRIVNSLMGHASKNRIEDHYGEGPLLRLKKDAIVKALTTGAKLLKKEQELIDEKL